MTPDEERAQDPHVERLRPDPSRPAQPVLTFSGFLGDSDRAGFRRLYFTRGLDYYAEFRSEDVVETASIPADQAPFAGLDATRLTLKRDATVDYTRTRTGAPLDEFEIDVRLWPWPRPGPRLVNTIAYCLDVLTEEQGVCAEATLGGHFTCDTCLCGPDRITQGRYTCLICETDQAGTCVTCGGGECPDSLVSCHPCR
jgi:hypothetical protein